MHTKDVCVLKKVKLKCWLPVSRYCSVYAASYYAALQTTLPGRVRTLGEAHIRPELLGFRVLSQEF